MENYFIKGMDVSFLDEVEAAGGVFTKDGAQEDCLAILQGSGVNAIRLRIWNDPPGGFNNLERTLLMAKRIRARGLSFLLDFHYSDQWADPAKQWKPKAWEGLSFEELRKAVFHYTKEVLLALKEQGTPPEMVQIGNEITPGMLWDDGRVGGEEYDNDEQWEKFTSLVRAGIDAAREASPASRIMIHIDRGGDVETSLKFFDRFEKHGVSFDVIGQSFYPWWHGTLDDLKKNLHELAQRYDKDIIVVETAYPWTLEKKEGLSFIVDKEEQLHAGYPGTVEGQAAFLKDLVTIVQEAPNGRGIGFYWWEPCWTPVKPEWSVGHGNNWSNLTLFDFEGGKLSSLNVLKSEPR